MGDETNKELAKVEPAERAPVRTIPVTLRGVIPTSIQETVHVAKLLAASQMFKHKTAETAFAAISVGAELGLPPAAAMRAVDIIDGKPAPSADALVAACLNRPELCRYFVVVEETPESCTVETWRVGAPGPRRMTFSLADAAKAGLTKKDVWVKYGSRMLYHRAAAWLAREVFPDVTLGMYSADELAEIAEDRAPRAAPVRVEVSQPAAAADPLATALDRAKTPADLARVKPDIAALPKGDHRARLIAAYKAAEARIADALEREAIAGTDDVSQGPNGDGA